MRRATLAPMPAAPLAADGERRLADVGQGERAVTGHRPNLTFEPLLRRGPRVEPPAPVQPLPPPCERWWPFGLCAPSVSGGHDVCDLTISLLGLRLQARRHEACSRPDEIRVLGLQPAAASPTPIEAARPLRHDAFEGEWAPPENASRNQTLTKPVQLERDFAFIQILFLRRASGRGGSAVFGRLAFIAAAATVEQLQSALEAADHDLG